MATLLRVDGTAEEIKDIHKMTFKDIYSLLGCETVDIVGLPSGKFFMIDDNGKLDGKEENKLATDIWKSEYPVSEYPINNDESIVGNVIIMTAEEDALMNQE